MVAWLVSVRSLQLRTFRSLMTSILSTVLVCRIPVGGFSGVCRVRTVRFRVKVRVSDGCCEGRRCDLLKLLGRGLVTLHIKQHSGVRLSVCLSVCLLSHCLLFVIPVTQPTVCVCVWCVCVCEWMCMFLVVANSLRQYGTTSAVLTDPSRLSQEAIQAATQRLSTRHWHPACPMSVSKTLSDYARSCGPCCEVWHASSCLRWWHTAVPPLPLQRNHIIHRPTWALHRGHRPLDIRQQTEAQCW